MATVSQAMNKEREGWDGIRCPRGGYLKRSDEAYTGPDESG
jgi:hypothetical protein